MHAVIHIWYNQATIIGLKLNIKTLWSVFELFEYMRDAENLYEGSGAPYKKNGDIFQPCQWRYFKGRAIRLS